MGKLYQQVGRYLHGTFDDIIVEIGTDRWEGSTAYFADLANTHQTTLTTVDIDAGAQQRIIKTVPKEHLSLVNFVCAEAVEWTRTQFNKKIKVLYLDNFDWDWRTDRLGAMIAEQKKWYADLGIEMTNLNCQASHIAQMINLLPHMSTQCVVCVDDTYEYNGVYIGKGGAVVPYLMANNFGILQSQDYGVILGRGYRNYIV